MRLEQQQSWVSLKQLAAACCRAANIVSQRASATGLFGDSEERASPGRSAGHGGAGFGGKEVAGSRSLPLVHPGKLASHG